MARPQFLGLNFKTLFNVDRISLEAPFTIEEAKLALESYDGGKAPSPNDFNLNFLKKFGVCYVKILWDFLINFPDFYFVYFKKYSKGLFFMESKNFVLEVINGTQKGQTFDLESDKITIGRRIAPKERKRDWSAKNVNNI